MRYWLRFLLLTVLLLTSVGYTFAQDEDVVTLPLGGAFTMSVPESWEITQPTSSGYFFESSDSTIRIRTYSPLDLEVFEVEVGNATDLMEYLVTVAYEADYDEDLLETVQFGDHEGVRYTLEELFEGRTFQRTVMLYTSETDFVIGGNLIPLEGSEVDADDTDAVAAALATVEYPGVFAFYEGSELEIPEEWHLLHDSNVSFSLATFTNGSLQFDLRLWPSYGAISGLDTPVDFLANFFFDNGIFSDIASFRRDNLVETSAAGFDAVFYPVTSDTVNATGVYERGVLAFLISNNSGFTVRITSEMPDEPLDDVFDLIDTLQPGSELVCVIFVDPGTRIRSEPSTNAELVRQTNDERFVGMYQQTDDAGNVWYYIGEGWVRSDVVYDYETCGDVAVQR